MALFAVTLFVSAYLLFLIQPIIARFILPWFGGSASVWNTCLVFYQVVLVAGYAYAHGLTHARGRGTRIWLHGGLIVAGILSLPVAPDVGWRASAGEEPTWRILGLLLVAIGPPLLLLSSTAPLLQGWWSRIWPARSPYPLYALSNVGSLAALLSYPVLVEPFWGVRAQTRIWSGAFAGCALLLAACAVLAWRMLPAGGPTGGQTPTAATGRPRKRWAQLIVWTAWAGCGSAVLLGVTRAISQDVSVVPLLWVGPLALYLISYVVSFGRLRWLPRGLLIPAFLAAGLGLVALLHHGHRASIATQVLGYFAVLLVMCLVCHGELARSKPPASELTTYYVTISVGGAMGGALVGIAAPSVLTGLFELHLSVAAIGVLYAIVIALEDGDPWRRAQRRVAWGLAILVGLGVGEGLRRHVARRYRGAVALHRSFYGELKVKRYGVGRSGGEKEIIHLLDGRISHGFQYALAARRREPTSYFVESSGVGIALRWHAERPRRLAILGLGAGTLATYGRANDEIWIYEINPDVIEVARRHFSFLSDCPAKIVVELDDGRLALERAAEGWFDVVVLDAFAGDAIPTHLLSREAFQIYAARLKLNGILAVNVSNRHVNVKPVVQVHAESLGMEVRWVTATSPSVIGPYVSHWLLMTRDRAFLEWPELVDRARPLANPGERARRWAWSDDHAPILPLLTL